MTAFHVISSFQHDDIINGNNLTAPYAHTFLGFNCLEVSVRYFKGIRSLICLNLNLKICHLKSNKGGDMTFTINWSLK